MSVKLEVVLTWVGRIAAAIAIAAPAVRDVVAELVAAKAEVAHIRNGRE